MTDDGGRDRQDVDSVTANGDEEAFRRLYRRHTPALYGLACRLLGPGGDGAEDVTQETWIRAVSRFGAFAWESSLRTWLSSIVVNCCRERWRANKEVFTADELPGEAPSPDQLARIDVESALARLPTGYRAVLVLHDVLGLTHEEIGRHLAIEAGTSKSQLSRARRAMRRLLGDDQSILAAEG